MLLFMTLFRMSAHVHDVLLMHRHPVIEEVFPRLQQKREDQRIAFRLGEALEVWRTIALGQREEVSEERGSHTRGFKRIDPRRGDGVIPLQIGLYGGNGRGRWVIFEGGKGGA